MTINFVKALVLTTLLSGMGFNSFAKAEEVDPRWLQGHSNKFISLVVKRLKKIENIDLLEPSLRVEQDAADVLGFEKQIVTKRFKVGVDRLWSVLVDTPPNKVWTGPHVNFALSYSKRDKKYYPNDEFVPRFHEGLIVVNVLDILGPKVAVALEVLRLDQKSHTIELSYSQGGATDGAQIISLTADGDETVLTHTSYYRGENKFRSNVLYPTFHKMMLKEYYLRIASLIADR